ncbi:hypothetical protein [Cohnella sp. GCM10027633]|uniref:hypothetical protein n=1 Tax=unclassified Cohnella TaxID=2636738 RepID=UPI00363A91BB
MHTTAIRILRHLNRFRILYIACAIVAIAIALLSRLSIPDTARPEPTSTNYDYDSFVSNEGVSLHILRTLPDHIRLNKIDNNVTASGVVGVNGGFFWEKQLLSVAVEDGVPVGGQPGARGSGWFNAKYARGTLVYDRTSGNLSVQVVSDASELVLSDDSRYWAQGGISLSLRDDAGWREQAELEAIPVPDEYRLRSGMAYDDGEVYLIVTDTRCTAEQFRDAIREYGNAEPRRLIDGIFLDGDGSSQLLSREAKLAGDGRPVLQMIGVD